MSDCCGAPEKKESKWGIKDCRARKCPDLQRDPEYPDSPQTCAVIHGMPGAMPMCVKEMDDEQFIRRISARLNTSEFNSPSPGVKNCPDACPYKLVSEGESEKGRKVKKGVCALTGWALGSFAVCPCNVLGNPRQEDQIERLRTLVEMRLEHCRDDNPVMGMCAMGVCPDGKDRDEWIDGNTELCPIIRMKKSALYGGRGCPLWKIPPKLLKASAATRVQEPTENVEKPHTDNTEELNRAGCPTSCKWAGKCMFAPAYAGCLQDAEEYLREHPDRETPSGDNSKPVLSSEKTATPEKRKRKAKSDHVCEDCRERYGKPIPGYVCAGCKEDQKTKGRRAWITDLQLGTVHLGDVVELGEKVPSCSVDGIFTDPPYIKELWEQAYADLCELATRVLKPYGFLFTYAPQAHLAEIMEQLYCSHDPDLKDGCTLVYFWIISSLNSGPAVKAHKWNALCLHKPILVFQKIPEGGDIKGVRRCFSDVVRGFRQKKFHPWQQSVHDVLGIISRFMAPGEILLDPYAGTGTSLIAANLLGMEWIGFEIEPKTHAIAVRELQQQPIGLFTFGGEEPDQTAPREIKEEKDTSKQAAIYDTTGKTVKQIWHDVCDKCEDGCKGQDDPKCLIKRTRGPSRPDPENPISQVCIECDVYKDCLRRDPYAGCLDAVKAIIKAQEERDEGEQGRHPAGPGGPTPGTCGTCGHHKGKKTFHPSCPRLGELLFMKGTKSAKVLMEETQRERCGHWLDKNDRCKEINDLGNCTISERCDRKTFEERAAVGCSVPIKPVKPKRDTPEWFEALTEAKRRNNPGWIWEVWKHDPAKGEWLYEGADTYQGAVSIKNQIEETRPDGSKVHFSLRPRPKPDYPTDDIEGPCKVCKIECIDEDGNDGCWEFEEHVRRLEEDGEPASPRWGYREICIISCGKAKIWDEPAKGRKKTPARVVAREAYTGPLFTLARKYAEHVFEGDEYYILSDKYGLIRPGDEIENYDVSPEDIENDPEFFDMVQQRAKADPDLAVVKKITLLCGQIHQRIIEGAFHGVEIINPVQDLPQGKRMHALKQLVEHKEPSKEYGAEKNCDNCLGCGGGIILRDCPSFDDVVSGKLKAEDLISSVKKDGCSGWKPGVKIAEKKPPSKKKRSPKKPKECETP